MKKKQLKEFANLLNGYAFKSKNYVSSGIRIMRIANVKDGYICDEQPCYYPEETYKEIEKYMLKAGDMLISLTGNVGRTGIIPANMLPAALNQRVSCIRLKDDSVNKKYLFYFFQRKSFVQDCIKASKGVAQLNLSTKFLEGYFVPVPPLPEQERIVTRIEELFSELDKAVETLKTTKQQLAVYRQAVLKEAFGGGFTNTGVIPLHNLGEFIDTPRYGTSKKCNYVKTATTKSVIRIPNINSKKGIIDYSDVKFAEFDESELEPLSLKEGDILIIRSNGSASIVGTAAIIRACDTNNIFAGYLMRLRIKDKNTLLPKYLLLYLSSLDARLYIERTAKSTSGVNNINAQEVTKLPIPVVDIEEQQIVITEIESRLSLCDQIEMTIEQSLKQAEAMRQSILKKAFEGRL